MRNHILSCIALGSILMLASCGNDTEFTQSTAEKAVKKEIKVATDNYQHAQVNTGYYELDSKSDRYRLRKLAAAGMITYKAEVVTEVRGSYYTYEIEHVFVNVALTEEGQKYVLTDEEVEKIKEAVENADIDEDLVGNNDETEYPEDKVSEEENFGNNGTAPSQSSSSNSKASRPQSTTTSNGNVAEMSDYEKAKAKEIISTVYVETTKTKVVKARDLRCTEEMMKNGRAEAEVIFEMFDVTPFGRILSGVRDGERKVSKVNFIYYNDKGWVAES